MKRSVGTVLAAVTVVLITCGVASASVRIKDVTRVNGVRDNQLIGYGLVVGLKGSGDGIRMTKQTVANMLQKLGLQIEVGDINVDNIAAVMVTANLPAFVRPGETIDVVVSSVGDADSLQGGTLLMTPLKGPDGRAYAVAQGPVSLGGWNAQGGGAQNTKGHPTVGRIPGGANVEREVPSEITVIDGKILFGLNNPDFGMAANVADGIDKVFGKGSAKAIDPATVEVKVPEKYIGDLVPFIADVGNLQVEQDQIAKVVINEKTGTIVMGGDVTVTPVAIAHGALTVTIKPVTSVSQPGVPLAGGSTAVTTQRNVKVKENKVSFTRVSSADIVDALNKMEVTPSDIIAIFQALKASGALQADLIVM